MAQPFGELQAALVTALRGDTGVQAAMVGAVSPLWNILDGVPVFTQFPYLYVGDMVGRLGTAFAIGPNGKATDIMATIHIFSQYPGWKEIDAIISAIDNLLNEKPLTLANGFTNFFLLFDNYIPIVEKSDIPTRHGALRYKFMLQGG